MARDLHSKDIADAALQRLDALQSSIHQVEAAAAAGSIGGLVAHEVRNLLTPAIAYVQLALTRPKDAAAASKALDRSLVAMRRACEVAELVLECTRPQSPQAENAQTDVSAVVQESLEALGWEHPTTTFHFQIDIPSPCGVLITADALRHVLINLMLNARTSLPEQGGRVHLEVRSMPGSTWNLPGAVTMIRVSDNGRGIEPMRLQQIRTGLRLQSTSTRPTSSLSGAAFTGAGKGSGFGLLLCNQLLAMHNGELHIESTPGAGTHATVLLRNPQSPAIAA